MTLSESRRDSLAVLLEDDTRAYMKKRIKKIIDLFDWPATPEEQAQVVALAAEKLAYHLHESASEGRG